MADDPTPNWENYPVLDGVITTADVETKGNGKFAATYVNHMKVSQLLRKHAAGWQFELRTTTDENARETHVYRAPNGSGYVVGFFRAPTGSGFPDTPDMVHAVMDHTMKPKNWDQITARDVTDTERRAMCVIAARHFGLAYELWAKDPIENPYRKETTSEPAPNGAKKQATRETPPQAQSIAKPAADPFKARREACQQKMVPLYNADKSVVDQWRNALKLRFDGEITADMPTTANLNTEEQIAWCEEWISDKTKATK